MSSLSLRREAPVPRAPHSTSQQLAERPSGHLAGNASADSPADATTVQEHTRSGVIHAPEEIYELGDDALKEIAESDKPQESTEREQARPCDDLFVNEVERWKNRQLPPRWFRKLLPTQLTAPTAGDRPGWILSFTPDKGEVDGSNPSGPTARPTFGRLFKPCGACRKLCS